MFYRLYARNSASGLLQIARKLEKGNDVTIFRHDIFIFFDVVLFLLSSLVTGSSFMSISFYQGVMSISFYQGLTRMRAHVHLVCDIYCAHAYFCGCDSTLFCFQKLKSRRLIFLINLSVFTKNFVSRAKKDEKRMINHTHKENVFFNSKLSPGQFSVDEAAEVDAHD